MITCKKNIAIVIIVIIFLQIILCNINTPRQFRTRYYGCRKDSNVKPAELMSPSLQAAFEISSRSDRTRHAVYPTIQTSHLDLIANKI